MGRRPRPPDLALAAGTLLAGAAAVLSLLTSDVHELHDPVHGLQQLDLLYLDQPAPSPAALELDGAGRQPTLLILCERCAAPDLPPDVDVRVRTSDDPALAEAYALRRADGRVGPGYAIIDAGGTLRYRTFDPSVGDSAREIAILLRGLP